MKKRFLAWMLAVLMIVSLLPATVLAEDAKEQIYWAVVDTDGNGKADKLVISSAEYALAEGETLVSEADKGSFDYDAVFDTRNDVPWKYSTYSGINKAVVEASNGKMVAPVSTRRWFDQAGIDRRQALVSVDLSGLSGERLEDMRVMFQYAKKLETVNFPADFDTSHVTDMSYMFNECVVLESVDVSMLDTSNVTTMECMFSSCRKLQTVDVSKWNTSNVTNMKWLFRHCHALKSVDVSNWDTSKVTNMQQVFNWCESLTEIDVSRWNTSNVVDMQMMFKSCKSLKTLDVSGWDTSKVTTMNEMFKMENDKTSTSQLEEIKGLENFDLSNVKNADRMFKGCINLKSLALDTRQLPEDASKKELDDMPNQAIVRVIVNGGTLPKDYTIAADAPLPTPTKDGCVFAGWYTDEGLTTEAAKDSAGVYIAAAGGTYYAKWEEADAVSSDILAAITGTNPFSDVPGSAYYNAAVRWAVKNGIASGTDAKHFSPDAACTRAQAVTFLWRAAGSPAPTLAENPFTDVKPSDYCYDAVLWAVENGIAKGTSAAAFSPDAACTRGQIVTFLYRAAGSPAGYANSGYTDVPEEIYCAAPVAWAVALRITSGTSPLTFSPDTLCTRAQIVTFLYRANA